MRKSEGEEWDRACHMRERGEGEGWYRASRHIDWQGEEMSET